MKKKIIALVCSPNKKGNSDTLLDVFIEGLKSSEIKVEKFYLYDIPQAFCDFPHKIPEKKEEPEFKKLCDKLEKADGIIISSPTYNFNVPAVLKNLIDRIGYFALDYKKLNKVGQPTGQLGDKKVFAIVTGGTPNGIKHFLFLLFPGFWLRIIFAYYGCYRFSTAYAGKLSYSFPVSKQPKVLDKFKKLGYKFKKKIKKKI